MIKKIKVTNHLGESIELEMRFPEKSGFLIRGINGLTPSKADINASELATKDGSIINSSRATSRNVVFLLDFIEKPTIEDTRHVSYKYFPVKRQIDIEIETDTRHVKTTGYVESNEPNIFSKQEGTTISVICPEAYLTSLTNQVTEFNGVDSLFEFPFSNESLVSKEIEFGDILTVSQRYITYNGDAPTGVIMHIHAIGPVSNLMIVDNRTQELIKIRDDKMISLTGFAIKDRDDIIISTIKGDKYITLIRDAVEINLRNALDKNPSWFQLERGDNLFSFTADSGVDNIRLRIENGLLFEGI